MTGPRTAAPAPRRAPRRDAAENRARLVQAASDVFGEHGTDVSLEQVAAAAGLAPATLYRRFATKADLVAELVDAVLRYLVDVAAAERDAPQGLGLERWLEEYADIQSRKRGFIGLVWAGEPRTAPLRDELVVALGGLLRDAQRAGRVRQDAGPGDVLLLVHALRGIAAATGYDDGGAWRRHLAVVLAGLRPGAGPDDGLGTPPWLPASL